jgi:hypothetical protein
MARRGSAAWDARARETRPQALDSAAVAPGASAQRACALHAKHARSATYPVGRAACGGGGPKVRAGPVDGAMRRERVRRRRRRWSGGHAHQQRQPQQRSSATPPAVHAAQLRRPCQLPGARRPLRGAGRRRRRRASPRARLRPPSNAQVRHTLCPPRPARGVRLRVAQGQARAVELPVGGARQKVRTSRRLMAFGWPPRAGGAVRRKTKHELQRTVKWG